jgi:hypothetical protein
MNEKDLISELSNEKIKINWNKNPVPMSKFLSFIACEIEKQTGHIGESTGWTLYKGENNLTISGGIVNGVEYLDSIQYGNKLHNRYNNYVNPLFLREILTKDGYSFFVDYYDDDIVKILNEADSDVSRAIRVLDNAKNKQKIKHDFWSRKEKK